MAIRHGWLAEAVDRQEWIDGVKRRLGLVTAEDRARERSPYKFVSMSPVLVSPDCMHWYEKPDGMSVAEFLDSLR